MIERETYVQDKPLREAELKEAIRKWDEFTEPLRKEFGIPRWKPKPKNRSRR